MRDQDDLIAPAVRFTPAQLGEHVGAMGSDAQCEFFRTMFACLRVWGADMQMLNITEKMDSETRASLAQLGQWAENPHRPDVIDSTGRTLDGKEWEACPMCHRKGTVREYVPVAEGAQGWAEADSRGRAKYHDVRCEPCDGLGAVRREDF